MYVTGYSTGDGGGNDYATIKYDADGNELWARRYNGPWNDNMGNDAASSLAVDDKGNVYVTGFSQGSNSDDDYVTIKYDATGNELWVKRYNGPGNNNDGANSVAVDGAGNVYVTGGGYGSESLQDYTTIKYDAGGKELWIRSYNGPANEYDIATSMAVDAAGNVYVTGYSPGSPSNNDFATVKYDAGGNELWVKRYNGSGNGYDVAVALALDKFSNIYITGTSYNNFGDPDYATIKYDTNGKDLWVKRYDGVGHNFDEPRDLVVDAKGNVYVTGEEGGNYATIKYSQASAVAAVTSFTLINTRKDEEVRELHDGDTIDITALPSLNLNIRANTTPDSVGSVRFELSGPQARTHTESFAPYALFANNEKDYYPWTPPVGHYTLSATPYTLAKGKGEKGKALTIQFTVIGTALNSLVLVNVETDSDLLVIRSGDVINLSSLPTTKLNIRALTNPDTVGSVVFSLNNKVMVLENYAPYLIGGDIKGNYRPWTLPVGAHRLTATPYELKNGKGKQGVAHTVYFTVIDPLATSRMAGAISKNTNEVVGTAARLWAAPNPFRDKTTLSFNVPITAYTTVEVYDNRGALIERLYAAWAEKNKVYRVQLKNHWLPAGLYTARLATNGITEAYQLVRLR